MNNIKGTRLGTKILYSIVIAMSGLILLFSALGVLGIWLVQGRLSEATVSLLRVVESSAKVARGSVDRVDQVLSTLKMQTGEIANAVRPAQPERHRQRIGDGIAPGGKGTETH